MCGLSSHKKWRGYVGICRIFTTYQTRLSVSPNKRTSSSNQPATSPEQPQPLSHNLLIKMNNPNFPPAYSAAASSSAYASSSSYAAASSSSAYYASLYNAPTMSESFSDDDLMPWEQDGWVPRMKSGKQKTPNMVRIC